MDVLRYISWLQFILIWLYILLPLLELYHLEEGAEKPFPYRMRFPYDSNQTLAYSITYFLTSLAGFGVVTNLFSEDSMFAFFTTYTCGRFRLLHEHIDGLVRNSQERALDSHPNLMRPECSSLRPSIIHGEYRDHLISIIRDHNVLIRCKCAYLWNIRHSTPFYESLNLALMRSPCILCNLICVFLQLLRGIACLLQPHSAHQLHN